MLLDGLNSSLTEPVHQSILIDLLQVAVSKVSVQLEGDLPDLIAEREDLVLH